jgi:hypothetical protein
MREDIAGLERRTRPTEPIDPKPSDGDEGPARPDVDRPDTRDLLRRMRRVDPDQARRYRQRTGE